MRGSIVALLALTALAACVPAAAPEQGHRPPPPAPPPPAPAVQPADWQDWAVTPGDWSYVRTGNATIARFGQGTDVRAWVRCDLASRRIAVGRSGVVAGAGSTMTIRTTFGALQWPAQTVGGAMPGTEAGRAASDPGLDQIAFSRGRFTLELPGLPPLVLPGWAEPVRVIEDCRG